MALTWAQRREELLSDCIVSPDVFTPMIDRLAASAGLSRKGLQKVLSEEGNPYFESVNAIIHAMGYYLVPQKLTDTPRP